MKPIKRKYQCSNCESLHDEVEAAAMCCPPDEVYVCGKKRKTRNGFSRVCVHTDRTQAARCQRTDYRKLTRNKERPL